MYSNTSILHTCPVASLGQIPRWTGLSGCTWETCLAERLYQLTSRGSFWPAQEMGAGNAPLQFLFLPSLIAVRGKSPLETPATQLTVKTLPSLVPFFLPSSDWKRERTIWCYSQEPHTFCYRSKIKGAIIWLKAKQNKNCRNSVLLSSHAFQPLCVCLIYMACSHIGIHRIDYIRGWDLQTYTHINVFVCMCIYGASQEAQW